MKSFGSPNVVVALLLSAAVPLVSSFVGIPNPIVKNGSTLSTSSSSVSSLYMAAPPAPKGFDSSNKPTTPIKSSGQVKRETESAKYDQVAAAGGQEYSIFVRQFGGADGSWLPCGSVAVPRTMQVSEAIFGNEQALKKSIIRTFPKLMGYELEFEYGYNLKIYPDDPVEIAKKATGPKPTGLSLGNWISTLLSPIDTSQSKLL